MSYKLIYTIPYASLNNEACVVEIEKEDYTGLPTELTGSESPFEVEIDDNDFLYAPTRFSTARIRVVGSDYLQELYSTSYQQYRVTFKRDGVVTWCGFVKPEVYTQDYSSDKFELEIECMSAMSVLEFIKYKQTGADGKVFTSLWDLLKKCVVASRGQYSAVYIPHVYAKDMESYAAWEDVLIQMLVSEQDFFDEDDKPMKLKEVLEEMCKFLNWTCVDYLGELYFVDMDHDGEYYRYNLDMTVFSKATRGPVLNVQKVGFLGNNHALDFLPGYNKCIVRTSNYPVGSVFIEEDFNTAKVIDRYKKINSSNPSAPQRTETTYVFLKPNTYKDYHYVYNEYNIPDFGIEKGWNIVSQDRFEETSPDIKLSMFGATIMKRCEIQFKDGVSSAFNYDFENLIKLCVSQTNFVFPNTEITTLLPIGKVLLNLGEYLPCASYIDGAISINMSILTDGMARQTPGIDAEFNFQPIKMYFKLKIGEYYYNGTNWVKNESTFGVEFENTNRAYEQYNFINVKNTKTIDMPYNGMSGYIIPIKGIALTGSPSLQIVGFFARGSGVYDYDNRQFGCFVKDIKVQYQKEDIDGLNVSENSDRYYENIVNEDYINELDEIEFKISSYNNDGACYSKVLIDGKYLTDNLYSSVMGEPTRPEEQLIHRIINRYSATHVKLTQVIKETPKLTPLTKLSDNFMVDKKFMPIGGSIDYKTGQYRCIMVDV
ncbi:hypothetical protein [Bacteroides neonati]|uniref:hypothetical protein n=1 Tax=Bacteroides neonati TaxID=1347393 RepID=UPI0004ACC044|nr:hypothetical protein [Bacteroides neonati]